MQVRHDCVGTLRSSARIIHKVVHLDGERIATNEKQGMFPWRFEENRA